MVTLALRSCVARQEPYIPGALSILQGTVPGRARGLGHMVPTYFRRELRDRALQRRLRLRTCAFWQYVLLELRPRQTGGVVPRLVRSCALGRGIQYAAALTFDHWRLWNTGS